MVHLRILYKQECIPECWANIEEDSNLEGNQIQLVENSKNSNGEKQHLWLTQMIALKMRTWQKRAYCL